MSEEEPVKKKKKKKKKRDASEAAAPAARSSSRGRERDRDSAPERTEERAVERSDPPPPEPDPSLPPELAHDDREIAHRAVLRFAAILGVATVVVMGAMWSFSRMMAKDALAGTNEPAPMATELPVSPPEPRLQTHPEEGLRALREAEKNDLEGYGWVDQKRRVVRIPVARAIDILAERGLPAREAPPAVDSATVPSDGTLEPPDDLGGRGPNPSPVEGGAR